MQQLIFTSVPRGYQTGASGYCTAARSEQMRPGLVQRLEQMSVYSHRTVSPNPTILAYRLVDLGGVKYRVLSRIRDAGLDFTKRSNFIAHHLAFEPGESVGGASPAEILLFWDGWKDQWEENPAALQDEKGDIIGSPVKRLSPPCKYWKDLTGDPGWGAFPWNHSGSCCWVHEKLDEFELLHLMGESLRLKSSGKIDALWETSFTTYLGTIVEASKYNWSAWNELDPIPTGKELGKNLIRVESLKGDPIGNKELIEIARSGHPSSTPTSNIKQTQITPNEVKNQRKDRIPIEAIHWKEDVTKELVPNTKNKQKFFPAFLVTTVIGITAIGIIVLALSSYKTISDNNQKSSDEAINSCIDSISSNLSGGIRQEEAPNTQSGLTEEQLKPIKEKDQALIRSINEGVKNRSHNDKSVGNVLENLKTVKNNTVCFETKEKIDALERKVNQLREQMRQEIIQNELKQEISNQIIQICQNDVIDYDRDSGKLKEIKTKWNDKNMGPFPYEPIGELIEIAKLYSSKTAPSKEDNLLFDTKLDGYLGKPEAKPYALKVIQHAKDLRKKMEKPPEQMSADQINAETVVFSKETRRLENFLLEQLFEKKFVEAIFKDYPSGSVNYIFEDLNRCPEGIKDVENIFEIGVSGKYNITAKKPTEVFDEKRLLKNFFREQSKNGLVLVYKNNNKTNILVYKTAKPHTISVNSFGRKEDILSDLEIIKNYFEKTILGDFEGRETLRWSVTNADNESTKPPFGSLNVDGINNLSDTPYKASKDDYVNAFTSSQDAIVDVKKIEKLWENHPPFAQHDIRNIDEAVKEYFKLKDSLPSRLNDDKHEKEKLEKIQVKIREIRSKYKIYYEDTEVGQNIKREQTLEQFGKSLNIKIRQLREFLLLPPAKDVTQIKPQEYEEISDNKKSQTVIIAWTKYQKYLELKNKADQPKPQKEYEWVIKNLLSASGMYKLYFGPGEFRYFQVIWD